MAIRARSRGAVQLAVRHRTFCRALASSTVRPARIDGMSTRTAVVTGASSGIGEATARRLASEGFHVLCAARREDRITALAEEIGGTAIRCDVTDADSVAGLAAVVGDRLDVLVNNAGGAFGTDPVAESDPDAWRRMYEVNAVSYTHLTLPTIYSV